MSDRHGRRVHHTLKIAGSVVAWTVMLIAVYVVIVIGGILAGIWVIDTYIAPFNELMAKTLVVMWLIAYGFGSLYGVGVGLHELLEEWFNDD